jgi:hypothetical protein
MKTKFINTVLFTLLTVGGIFAQDVTTVRANNSDISDNLNLQAVASIFGESQDLEDFERRLNDPDKQINNLDLNGDNRVDYLRVIEVTENNTHVIILQSVLAVDTFQDVATIEVERDRNNNVTVQVVGDSYVYGPNYIYEPVYVATPPLYNVFWASSYRPYYSPWYYGYYPTYYSYWSPYPAYRYRNHVHVHINTRNSYNYVSNGRNSRAVALYNTRRSNDYERQHPNNSFTSRNGNVTNRYQLDQRRGTLATSRGTRASSNRVSRNTDASKTSDLKSNGSRGTVNRNSGITPVTNSRSTFNNSSSRNNAASQSVRSSSSQINTAAPARSYTPAATRRTYSPASNAAPVRSAAPAATRSYTPANNAAPVRSAAPATRSFNAPSQPVRSAPATMSAPTRSAAPAATSSARQGNGGGGRRN